ncbi:MAG: DUF427 domain-containing protein [Rhodobacteraceae bacterium]|nr:DUF427 domain-containing protein [Paracoccaceae bacterium]
MADHITIRKAEGKWVIRACGAVLGETDTALELTEGRLPPVIYFPRGDIAMAFFEPSGKQSNCPHKGDASYFTIQGHSQKIQNAAWSYEDPLADVAMIKDHLAFYSDEVTIERI